MEEHRRSNKKSLVWWLCTLVVVHCFTSAVVFTADEYLLLLSPPSTAPPPTPSKTVGGGPQELRRQKGKTERVSVVAEDVPTPSFIVVLTNADPPAVNDVHLSTYSEDKLHGDTDELTESEGLDPATASNKTWVQRAKCLKYGNHSTSPLFDSRPNSSRNKKKVNDDDEERGDDGAPTKIRMTNDTNDAVAVLEANQNDDSDGGDDGSKKKTTSLTAEPTEEPTDSPSKGPITASSTPWVLHCGESTDGTDGTNGRM